MGCIVLSNVACSWFFVWLTNSLFSERNSTSELVGIDPRRVRHRSADSDISRSIKYHSTARHFDIWITGCRCRTSVLAILDGRPRSDGCERADLDAGIYWSSLIYCIKAKVSFNLPSERTRGSSSLSSLQSITLELSRKEPIMGMFYTEEWLKRRRNQQRRNPRQYS